MGRRTVLRIGMAVAVAATAFTFVATDTTGADEGAACDGIGQLGIINNAPRALDDEVWVEPGGSVVIDVLANDTDFDGDALLIRSVSTPGAGAATLQGSVVEYSPGLGFEGEDAFVYSIDDGKCGVDEAQVRVRVADEPPPPERAEPPRPVITVPTFTG